MPISWGFKREWLTDFIIIAALAIVVLSFRIPIAANRTIMEAGDAFNFQHIASHISHFSYPPKEKRLPVYALFILIGRRLTFDPLQTAIGISLIASAGTIVSLYGLGRLLHVNRVALLGMLGLAVFDPLLVINAVRPLADGTFVCLAVLSLFLITYLMSAKPPLSRRWEYGTGLVVALMMFTRYEGFLIAAVTLPWLLFRLPWRSVLRVVIVPTVFVLAWIPAYIHIYGSATGLSYVTDATTPGGGFGEVSQIAPNFDRMMNGSGFKRVISYPTEMFAKGITLDAILQVVGSANWWVGAFAIIGLVYVVWKNRLNALPVIVGGSAYVLLLSWWWVYSRYVAPVSALFYLSAAAGLTAVISLAIWALKKLKVPAASAWSFPLLFIIITPIINTEAPRMAATAINNAWESDGKGYDVYSAMKYARSQKGLVVYPTEEHADATLFYGSIKDKPTLDDPARGVYLSFWPTATAAELYQNLATLKPRWLIDLPYDKRQPDLLSLLQNNHNIAATHPFTVMRTDTNDLQTTLVYELTWPQP
jgi:hypothetical protein